MTRQVMYVDFQSHRPYCDECSNNLVEDGMSFLEIHLDSSKDALTCTQCETVISFTPRRVRTK
jgi:RNase P subunit RPR2